MILNDYCLGVLGILWGYYGVDGIMGFFMGCKFEGYALSCVIILFNDIGHFVMFWQFPLHKVSEKRGSVVHWSGTNDSYVQTSKVTPIFF
jgi:hypothetical protein